MKDFIKNNKILLIFIFSIIVISIFAWIFQGTKNSTKNSNFNKAEDAKTQAYVDSVANRLKNMEIQLETTPQEAPKSFIKFVGNDYGPSEGGFDYQTKVGNVYYPLKDSTSDNPDEQIFVNYYFQGVYGDNIFTAEDITNMFSNNSDFVVEHKFEAPDTINKKSAYLFFISSIDQDGVNGRATIIKVAYIGEDVYSVVFSKKIDSKGKDAHNEIIKWLTDNIKIYGSALGNVGPDDAWVNFLKIKSKF